MQQNISCDFVEMQIIFSILRNFWKICVSDLEFRIFNILLLITGMHSHSGKFCLNEMLIPDKYLETRTPKYVLASLPGAAAVMLRMWVLNELWNVG